VDVHNVLEADANRLGINRVNSLKGGGGDIYSSLPCDMKMDYAVK
jgi:hypothetical protein